jgi:hypothetical protein
MHQIWFISRGVDVVDVEEPKMHRRGYGRHLSIIPSHLFVLLPRGVTEFVILSHKDMYSMCDKV